MGIGIWSSTFSLFLLHQILFTNAHKFQMYKYPTGCSSVFYVEIFIVELVIIPICEINSSISCFMMLIHY